MRQRFRAKTEFAEKHVHCSNSRAPALKGEVISSLTKELHFEVRSANSTDLPVQISYEKPLRPQLGHNHHLEDRYLLCH